MLPLTFLLIGRSGCGKGTQSALLQAYLKKEFPSDIRSLEGGAELRRYILGEGYSQRLSRAMYEKGELQPAFISIWLWAGLLIGNITGEEHLVIDGAARRLTEAEALDSALDFYKKNPRFVLYINVSKEWATERLLERSRADDTRAHIDARLAWFETEVVPSVNFFRNNPKYNFLEINGEQTVEKVHQEVVSGLQRFLHGSA